MTTRLARCACGQLRVRCDGEPATVSLCHCRECQRRTGSTYGIAAFYEPDRIGIIGESTVYSRKGDSGFSVRFHFCPACGSTLFWYPERVPGVVAVAVGGFADPAFPPPEKAVYGQHRHPWVVTPGNG